MWAKTKEFVAIRDLKMCGCPPGFVAGLALPRARVTGIEDPRRPEGIWPFAWQVARTRIPDERQIALAINPKDARSENQMHVHMLRLRPETRAWLDASDGAPTGRHDGADAAEPGRGLRRRGGARRRRADGRHRHPGRAHAGRVAGGADLPLLAAGVHRERLRDYPRSTVMSVTGTSKPFSMRLPAGSKRSCVLSACAASSGVTSSSFGTACSTMRAARLTIGP